jgi:pyruvate/2-oxoglutarate dehydrogenase complex dihydrolipoamide acyltransferase (E2) component
MRIDLSDIISANKKAVISQWYVDQGSRVRAGDDLLEVVTDKASFDVSAPCSGKVEVIYTKKGAEVGPSEIIARIVE